MVYQTEIDGLILRNAAEEDAEIILGLIKELADYERLSQQVTATVELIKKNIFQRKIAEVILAEYNGEIAGQALFFYNFSTFLGKPGIYLEDLYVKPKFRKLGIGKCLLKFVGKLAVERECGRYEWVCLDWNKPSLEFYKSLGAQQHPEWVIHRVSGQALKDLAE